MESSSKGGLESRVMGGGRRDDEEEVEEEGGRNGEMARWRTDDTDCEMVRRRAGWSGPSAKKR